jgi:hypothetical protein
VHVLTHEPVTGAVRLATALAESRPHEERA